MKTFDKILRWWRVQKALTASPKKIHAVFDIGCDDGYLLRKFAGGAIRLDGCDPRLSIAPLSANSTLLKGYFPSVLDGHAATTKYDAIFAIAVFEHLTETDLKASASVISGLLSDKGRLIITVPHPFVDHILAILMSLRIVEAKTLDEHHGFDPNTLVDVLSSHLKLVERRRFQLGLNNLFVFEKNRTSA